MSTKAMPTRPEYVKCVLTGEVAEGRSKRESWCGRSPDFAEWTFVDATHAALNGRNGGRLLTCPECRRAIGRALRR